jgi:glutamine synthetase
MGVMIEYHHHEVATAGQIELDYRPTEAISVGDNFFTYKFAARNIAAKYGWIATFMPKPLYLDNASGMHTHQSLWKGEPFKGENAFYDKDDDFHLSQTARYYIGGLIEHSKALTAICCPTVNSYKRLVPGFEAPINISWSPRNRSALIRVPTYFSTPKAIRCEYRAADPSCNPYLAFAAMLSAGLDGIKSKIEPGDALRADMYELTSEEKKKYGVG